MGKKDNMPRKLNPDSTISRFETKTYQNGTVQYNEYRTVKGSQTHDHTWFNLTTGSRGFIDRGFGTEESHLPKTDYGHNGNKKKLKFW